MYKALIAAALLSASPVLAEPVPGAFTYQGDLSLNGSPIDGTADLIFRLYDGPTLITSILRSNVDVNNGLFSTDIDFGSVLFDGTNYDIEIAARSPAGSGGFTTLSPRQAINTTPYAYHSNSADTLLTPAEINDGTTNNFFDTLLSTSVAVESTMGIGIAGYTEENFGVAGIIDQNSSPTNAAAVLGQVFGGTPGQISVWALNSVADTSAELATDQYAGDFFGPVRTNSNVDIGNNLAVGGTITRAFSPGTLDLATPIAYGYITTNGDVIAGTPNVSSVYNFGNSRYEITIDGESYSFTRYVTVVTPIESDRRADTGSVSGRLLVQFENTNTNAFTQTRFHFVTYKPDGAALVQGRNRPALQPLVGVPSDEEIDTPTTLTPRTPITRPKAEEPNDRQGVSIAD